jgi:hypothetical protein
MTPQCPPARRRAAQARSAHALAGRVWTHLAARSRLARTGSPGRCSRWLSSPEAVTRPHSGGRGALVWPFGRLLLAWRGQKGQKSRLRRAGRPPSAATLLLALLATAPSHPRALTGRGPHQRRVVVEATHTSKSASRLDMGFDLQHGSLGGSRGGGRRRGRLRWHGDPPVSCQLLLS